MKKKLSILIALVMALLLCLTPVIALAATTATLTFEGDGTAEWSTEQKVTGDYSAKLYVESGVTDWAEVSIPVDIAIESFTALSFYEYIDDYDPNGFTVQVILGIDADGLDGFEADLPAWHQGPDMHTATPLKGDTFIEFEFATGKDPTKDIWTERDALNDFVVWLPKADGTSGGMGYYGPYTGFLALLGEVSNDSAIEEGMRVKEVILQIGGSVNWMDETAYVDDVTINGDTYDLEPPPTPVRSPDAFDVAVRLGWDSTQYLSNGTLAGSIEAAGTYNDTQYMLEIPKGCVVTGTTGRVNWLWLASIDGNVLSFALEGDASFSEPCTLYIAEGGRIYQNYWKGEWLGDGEWVEVGTFTSIVDGEAHLD